MSLFCATHRAYIYDRGGEHLIAEVFPASLIRWSRKRDDISQATVVIPTKSSRCDDVLGIVSTGRHELVIFRGDERVWEGPITHLTYEREKVTIDARDVMHYVYRTVMKNGYNNAHPNITSILNRVETILRAELSRHEALFPPINVVDHMVFHHTETDARTSANTLAWTSSVFDHIDGLAARSGLDYVTVGRALHFFDVDTPLGVTPPVTGSDFQGDVIITEYGMELATYAAITDGFGHAGEAGGIDPFYGLVEVIHAAYDESTGPLDENNLPTVAELTDQAGRVLAGANPAPVVVRVPDGSTLNPLGTLTVRDLVPGVRIPLMAALPGRTLLQLQKLDEVLVEESGGAGVGSGVGETIRVSLSPAPSAEQGQQPVAGSFLLDDSLLDFDVLD